MSENDASGKGKIWHFNLRLSQAEYERLESLRERLQAKMGESVRVSQKTVFLEALRALEAYYEKLDRDKARER